jgi:hypothetical protein
MIIVSNHNLQKLKKFLLFIFTNNLIINLLSFLSIKIGLPVFLCLKLLAFGLEAPFIVPKIAFSA